MKLFEWQKLFRQNNDIKQMQFNRVNNKEHQCSVIVRGFLHMCTCQNFMCGLFEVLLHVLWVWTCSVVKSISLSSQQFSPPLPSLFPLFIQCDGCHRLLTGLPGFDSHGRSLHLGAGSFVFQAPNLYLVKQLLTTPSTCTSSNCQIPLIPHHVLVLKSR